MAPHVHFRARQPRRLLQAVVGAQPPWSTRVSPMHPMKAGPSLNSLNSGLAGGDEEKLLWEGSRRARRRLLRPGARAMEHEARGFIICWGPQWPTTTRGPVVSRVRVLMMLQIFADAYTHMQRTLRGPKTCEAHTETLIWISSYTEGSFYTATF